MLIVVLIAIGYRAPQESTGLANTALPSASSDPERPTVNEVLASNIAASVAETADLAVASAVTNLAISTEIKSELQQSDTSVITKPVIVQPSAASRNITSYVVVAGDTVDSVAARFGVSKDTIKWANNLTSDSLIAGTTLKVLPTTGILYTAKAGDTVQSLATKYKADASRIVLYNDLETNGLNAGLQIIIPNGDLPSNERPGYVAPFSYYSANFSVGASKFLYRNTKPTSAGNKHFWGNCTWYAWERRAEIGRPLPAVPLGNAAEWDDKLGAAPYRYTIIRGAPIVGAIMQNDGGLGHVAIVESIAANGDVTLSEMNFGGGYNIVSQRTITAGEASVFKFIY